MRSSGPPETLAARVRELAGELDAERQRTGIDTALPSATEEAERFLSEPQSVFHMTTYGNKIGEQLWRLWSLPDARTAAGDTAAPWEHDVDAFNREQRARREAYAQGLVDGDIASRKGDVPDEFCRADAAKRYPLKKREPRIIPDPHGAGEWRVHADGDGFEFREDSERVSWSAPENEDNALLWTPDRIRALAKLLDSPWAWVDDTTPEQEGT